MKYNEDIIPVTRAIRKYLSTSERNKDEKIDLSCFDDDLEEYMIIASEIDKSLVWVYQSMVLDGYGKYIDRDSDIYQASLIAFSDVLTFANNDIIWMLPIYEEDCILNGRIYNDLLFIDRLKKTKKRKK
ncbi:MAG: hypothetical protein IJI49_02465 [Bacilli bacterium]|nr:hypothetical protein [Bacilli bacterium]